MEIIDLDPLFPNLRLIELQQPGLCGPACLADAIRYLTGREIDHLEIARYLNVDPKVGTPHLKMAEGARHYGLNAEIIQDENLNLKQLGAKLEANPNLRIILNITPERSVDENGDWEIEKEGWHYLVFEGLVKLNGQEFVIYNNPEFPASIQLIDLNTAEKKWYAYLIDQNYRRVDHWALILTP